MSILVCVGVHKNWERPTACSQVKEKMAVISLVRNEDFNLVTNIFGCFFRDSFACFQAE